MSITFENIKDFVKNQGYKLLSKEYNNCYTKLLMQCPRLHQYEVMWTNFQQGRRCPFCAGKKITYQQVKSFIEDQNYKLLSQDYINNSTKLLIVCPRLHQYRATWTQFKRGNRCPYCSGNKKFTYQQVKNFVEDQEHRLLSKEYVNTHTKFLVECNEGHQYWTTQSYFQQGYRCPLCKESRGERQLYELLEQIFLSCQITRQDNLGFLERQTVDFAVRESKLAIEYDGEQHFKPVRFGGISIQRASRNFQYIQKLDKRKQLLCERNNYKLVRISYQEEMSLINIRKIFRRENIL